MPSKCGHASTAECDDCFIKRATQDEEAIRRIARAYVASNNPWYVGFSGGKDSSALVKLLYMALVATPRPKMPVTVIYVDTGVDIPIVTQKVRATLRKLRRDAESFSLPLRFVIARPRLEDRFFVKVVGRGYPPPTNKFRWCTDRLRINPVKRLVSSIGERKYTILLGTRLGESAERDRTMSRHRIGKSFYFRQANASNAQIFCPLFSHTTAQIWQTIFRQGGPEGIDPRGLWDLYRDAGSECPTLGDPEGSPCGKGRFGCWTCTVVRRDRAVGSLIDKGYSELEPLLLFRNWLAEIRDEPQYRCRVRRNGKRGLGPFTLVARELILKRLKEAQDSVHWRLLPSREEVAIRQLWYQDKCDKNYRER